MRFPSFRVLLLSFLLSVGSGAVWAGQIAGETFESYPAGRLKVASRGVWDSSTQAKVAEEPGQAKEGGKYLEIKTNAGTQKAERLFEDVPESGVYWLDFHVYNAFTPESLEGSETNPCVRLGNNGDYFLGVIFRPGREQIEVFAKESATAPARFTPTETSYSEPAWRRVTFRIDLSEGRADLYIDGRKSVSGLAVGGFAGGLAKVDIRGGLPVEADSFRVDEIGFYNEDPLKK